MTIIRPRSHKRVLLIAATGVTGSTLQHALERRGWKVARSTHLADAAYARAGAVELIVVDLVDPDDLALLRVLASGIELPIIVHAPRIVGQPILGLRAACLQVGPLDLEGLADAAEMLQTRTTWLPSSLPVRIGPGQVIKWSTRLRGPLLGQR